jgi:hypothetical protein
MLPLPNLPTDNLYKFISLSGVALFFVGVGFLFVEQKSFLDRYTGLREISARIVYQTSQYIEPTLKNPTRLTPSEIRQRIRVLDSLYAEQKTKQSVIEMQNTDHGIIQIACVLAIGLGLLIAERGFRLWYDRVQKYQDVILRNEAARPPSTPDDK